jgi:hypothetical protein
MSDSDVVPFKVDIPRSEVDRLKRKLQDTRLPPKKIVPEAGNKYGRIAVQIHIHRTNHLLTFNLTGPTYEWVRDLYTAWLDYDWYSVQDQINEFPHYTTRIEDVKLHFVHARSDRKDAIPLIMCHGWPGSFWEFSSVWGPLSHPSDPKDPAFHVVVPSLPGFCFSDWPPRAGWRLQDTARLFDQLMKRLGYEEYMMQGGDWSHWIGREMGSKFTDSCKLVHFNFAPSPLPEEVEYTTREKEVQGRVDDWLENHMGYAICMRTRVSSESTGRCRGCR